MAPYSHYLAVLKASYDYEPQSDDEIAIKEDQILILIERVDEDWWKVKVKDSDDNEAGLVPAAYVEPAAHKSVVKVIYDYDASAPGELSVKEDDLLQAFDKEEDWLLVQTDKGGGKAGFVPATYIEPVEDDGEVDTAPSAPATTAQQIIVPPPPPAPVSNYVDPAERVAAATSSKPPVDSIQTWSVAEVDKKGKKKKGTLGVGNGAVFFASESDKAPVQKYQIDTVENWRIDKSKHVFIDIGGVSATILHLNAGSKDVAEAIVAKLQMSKVATAAATPLPASPPPVSPDAEEEEVQEYTKPRKNGISVRFSASPPSIISPREPSENGDTEEDHSGPSGKGEAAVALYDFTADGEDELSVKEGERLTVIEKDGDDWWKCRNARGKEGVVPASYVEVAAGSRPASNGFGHGAEDSDSDDRAARVAEAERLAEEQRERERLEEERRQREREREKEREKERKRAESERQAKVAAEAAEAERKRKEREAGERERKEEEQARAELQRKSRDARPTSSSGHKSRGESSRDGRSPSPSQSSPGKSRSSVDTKPRGVPSPSRTRIWHDRTGQFKVEAEFLGFSNGKLRLHKVNGVVIEVPIEKMSPEDMQYIEHTTGKQRAKAMSPSDDDQPLAVRRKSLHPESKPATAKPVPPKKTVDWFEFFLGAGCDVDDCTRYASAFERDKIDESILPDITAPTMRSLGLREGDIIRVTKAIAQRSSSSPAADAAASEQLRRDEELARRLQAEETGTNPRRSSTSPAPNLFAGPGGALKNTRRGRPQPSKSTLPVSVDLDSLSSASQQITRGGSPVVALSSSPTSVSAPPRSSSAAPAMSGFDDDAWTNRPSSTKPLAPTPPATNARTPSAPPTQTAAAAPAHLATQPAPAAPPGPPEPAPTAATSSAPATATAKMDAKGGLAHTTEADVFDQLARLSQLRAQNAATNLSPPAATAVSPVLSPPPMSFQHGLGMGPSPIPMGQFQATQTTGFAPSPQPQQNIPRGPFAPVLGNQGLLQPLIPTSTGFNSFVPTRPQSSPLPSFQHAAPHPPPVPPLPTQPSFLPTQPTGFPNTLQPQFQPQMQPQMTGFPGSSAMLSHPAGFPGALNANGAMFGGLQPQPTGFNPGFGQFNQPLPPPPPPVPPLPPSVSSNTSPANVFAQMKSGTFGNEDAPQSSNKYDALRPQPTGWGYSGIRY